MQNAPVLTLDLAGIKKLKSGKVREILDLCDSLLFVASDRISAFDCIMPNGIPRKGEVLTQLSYFWFSQTESFQPNHLLSRPGDPLPPELQPHTAQHDRQKGPAVADRVRRARLPLRLGLEGVPRAADRVRHPAAAGAEGVGRA